MKRLLQITTLVYSICFLTVSVSAEGNPNTSFDTKTKETVALNVTINIGDATCEGASDGIAMALPDGGLPPYSYLWNTGATTQIITNQPVGNYSVTVTDNLGATASTTATIGESAPLNVVLAATYESSPGCKDGKVDVVKSQLGDTGPYTYLWSTGSTNFQITNLPAGIYCVTVTNAFGCTGTGCIELQLLPGGLTVLTSSTSVTCNGGNDGTATATPNAGTPPYTFQWDDPAMQTTSTAVNLPAGTYNVTVTDVGGCPAEKTVVIIEPPLLEVQYTIIDEDCNQANGSISLSASGGVPGYTYQWNNIAIGNTPTANNLSAGTYAATITDSNGCTVETGALVVTDDCITPPPSCTNPVVTSVVVFEASCGNNDGRATVNVASGPGGFSYDWTPNVSTTNTAANLASGTYTVVITNLSDATCTTSEIFTVGVLDGPQVDILSTTPATCRETNGTAVLGPIGLTYEWCNGYIGNNPINLPAGECQVTVTDPNTGCVDVIEVVIEEFIPLMATPTIDQQPDCNATNGAVTINVSGGSFNYVYDWSDGGSGASRTDLAPGAYCVTVTDNGPTGCVTTTCFVLTADTGNNLIVTVDSPVLLSCRGDNNGTVQYTISPNDPTYGVVITNAAGVVQTNGSLIPGSYCLTVSDATGCAIGGDCFEVVAPPQVDVDVDIFDKDCASGGAIDLVAVNGGNGGFTFAWSGPLNFMATTQNISNLDEGVYSVTITDSKGCVVVVDGITVEDICTCTPPVVSSVVVVEAHCGISDGRATVNVAGSISDYNFFWTPSVSNDNKAFNIPAGIYSVKIQDKTDATCFIFESFTVGATGGFDDVQANTVNASCNTADGSISLTPIIYQYRWEDGYVGDSRSDLAGGTYFVEITNPADPNSCIDFITLVVGEDNPLNITAVIDQKPGCQAADGIVTLVVTGGSNDYAYSWAGNGATQSGLAAGVYTVIVRDNLTGCEKTITFGLAADVPAATLIIDPIIETSCTGTNDAMVDFSTLTTAPGFVGPAVITIEDAQGNIFQSGDIPPGSYCAVIRDANACIAGIECFDVKYPGQIDVDIAIVDKDCTQEGSITLVEIIGGNGVYNYDWLDIAPSTNDPRNRPDLDAGTYTLVMTDGNGCALTEALTVADSSATISANISPDNVSCSANSDGSISVTPSGGTGPYAYDWGPGFPDTAVLENLPEGQYAVTVTDAAGCTTTSGMIDLVADNDLAIQSITPINISCAATANGSISIVPTGGTAPYSYDWGSAYPDTDVLTNLPEGQYEVTITDAAGCSTTAGPIDLIAENLLMVQSITPTNISCAATANGSISIVPAGGTAPYSYDWGSAYPDTAVLTNLPEGQYEVTITDAAGCSTTAGPIDLIAENVLMVQSITPMNITCFGNLDGSIEVIPMGGTGPYTYDWGTAYPDTAVLGNLPEGQYEVTITDASGCSVTSGPVELMADNNLNIQLTEDTTACTGTLDIGVVVNSTLPAQINWTDQTGTVVIVNGAPVLEVPVAGSVDYYVEVISGNCTALDTVTITEFVLNPMITPMAAACKGDAVQLNPNGDIAYNYSWSPADQLVDPNVPSPEILEAGQGGIFTAVISDPAKPECTVEREVTLMVNDLPTLAIDGDTIACAVEELELTASSNTGTTFEWSDAPDFSNPVAGAVYGAMAGEAGEERVYYVKVTDDATGCTEERSVALNNFAVRMTLGEPLKVCSGEEIRLLPTISLSSGEILDFVWSAENATFDISTPEEPLITATASTVIVADVTNNFGCTFRDSVPLEIVEIAAAVLATASPDTILRGQTSQLNIIGDENYEYLWNPSSTLSQDDIIDPVASPLESTTYDVEITSDGGCASTRSVEVVVIGDCASNLFFPNAFTPNNDGKNDVLYLRGAFVEEMYFAIYNRWGEKVFESSNINNGWDGTFKGQQLPPDVFGYYLRVTCIDGEEYNKQGNVSLLR